MKKAIACSSIIFTCLLTGTEAVESDRKLSNRKMNTTGCPGSNATTKFFRTDDPTKANGCISAIANPDHFCPRGAATHCPDACGTCDDYACGDSEVDFLLRNGQRMDCTFNKQSLYEIVRLCRNPQIKNACRYTCYDTTGCDKEPGDFISKFGYPPGTEVF